MNHNEDKRTKQIRFEFVDYNPIFNFCNYYSIVKYLFTNIKITMTLFGLFFAYNLGILFIAFINKYKRTLILTLILTILSAATFFTLLYVLDLIEKYLVNKSMNHII